MSDMAATGDVGRYLFAQQAHGLQRRDDNGLKLRITDHVSREAACSGSIVYPAMRSISRASGNYPWLRDILWSLILAIWGAQRESPSKDSASTAQSPDFRRAHHLQGVRL